MSLPLPRTRQTSFLDATQLEAEKALEVQNNMSGTLALGQYSEIPLLDGFNSVNYVEAIAALPRVDGLHAIRLVTILPGAPDSELHLIMSRLFIDEAGDFETLSYTWKGATFSQPLTSNKDRFLVTSSVEAALIRLR